MLDSVIDRPHAQQLTQARPAVQVVASAGPVCTDRAQANGATSMGRLLALALDEVDYGIVLLGQDAEVIFLNHRARQWLGENPSVQLMGSQLSACNGPDKARFKEALDDATRRGLRRLVTLGSGHARQAAAMVPVGTGVAALVVGKSSVCEKLSLLCFARSYNLTEAETGVLTSLGGGARPERIASEKGVKLSTVRTQISAIRAKVGVNSVSQLLQMVASLPPMVGVLRS